MSVPARWRGVLAAPLAGMMLALAFVLPAPAAPTFPDLAGRRVVDEAHVLSPQTQADLTAKLKGLEDATHRQLVVVTLPSLQGDDIADYGYQLGRKWGIGRAGANDGVLFIVAPTEHKVRVEVGYGLEPVLTDALSSVILQREVLPRFRTGDVEGGVVAGTNALVQQLSLDPSQAQAQVASAATAVRHHRSGGIGAIVPIIILFVIFSMIFRGRRGGGGLGWLLPMMILSSGSRRGGWGGGGGGGGWGGGGGGGFSGGGGSFGGGGASGSW